VSDERERLLSEDDDPIAAVPDARRKAWEPRPTGYTAEQARADREARAVAAGSALEAALDVLETTKDESDEEHPAARDFLIAHGRPAPPVRTRVFRGQGVIARQDAVVDAEMAAEQAARHSKETEDA
jgi:hypothetical protein